MDQLNETVRKIGVALKRAVAFAEQSDIPADLPLPMTDAKRDVRIAALLITRGFDGMEYAEIWPFIRAREEYPVKDSPEWLEIKAARLAFEWRELLHDQKWRETLDEDTWRMLIQPKPEAATRLAELSEFFAELDARNGARYFEEHARRFKV
jgi:hypothetical protein